MPAPSLLSVALKVAIAHANDVTELGPLPKHLGKSVVIAITNPTTLLAVEENNPEYKVIAGHAWPGIIQKEIEDKADHLLKPKNPSSWGLLYRKLVKKQQLRHERGDKLLRESFLNHEVKREKESVKVAKSTKHLPPPINYRDREEQQRLVRERPKDFMGSTKRNFHITGFAPATRNLVGASRATAGLPPPKIPDFFKTVYGKPRVTKPRGGTVHRGARIKGF